MPLSSRPAPAVRRAVTGRAIVLGTLVILLLVLLASPLNRYFGSRSDVDHAAQQLRDDKAKLAELTKQNAQWGDPGYIEQQAREQLEYAMPGDTVYTVVGQGAKTQLQKTSGPATVPQAAGSWNTRLWDSVERAGGTPTSK